MIKKKIRRRRVLIAFIIISILGLIIPQKLIIPVEGATKNDCLPDWQTGNSETFWYYPWGKSITHKGVDILAEGGTNILSSANGIVMYSGELGKGGNVVLILGPNRRLHYYAHIKEIKTKCFNYAKQGSIIATVGTSGNASGKAAHLHYSIVTLIPYPWRIDSDRQAWKKMFYLNPLDYF